MHSFNTSSLLYQSGVLGSVDQLQSISLALIFIPLSAIMGIVMVFILPAVKDIEDNKRSVLGLFLGTILVKFHYSRVHRLIYFDYG